MSSKTELTPLKGANDEKPYYTQSPLPPRDIENDPFGVYEYISNGSYFQDLKDKVKEAKKDKEHAEDNERRIARELKLDYLINDLKKKSEVTDDEVLKHLIDNVHSDYVGEVPGGYQADSYDAFVKELSEFVETLVERKNLKIKENRREKTLFHIAAEKNLLRIVKFLYKRQGKRVLKFSYNEKGEKYDALDCALKSSSVACDEVASFLIQTIKLKYNVKPGQPHIIYEKFVKEEEYTRDTSKEGQEEGSVQVKHNFSEFIQREDMKKTVIALLDFSMSAVEYFKSTKSPDEEDLDENDGDPTLRYQITFRLLECDEDGREPEDCKHTGRTCLQLLVESPHKKLAIRHPVVRTLMNEKWEKQFGIRCTSRNITYKNIIHFFALLYVIFIVCMSLAFFLQTEDDSPCVYKDTQDYARLVFELITVVFSFVYLVLEVLQLKVEKFKYFGIDTKSWKFHRDLDLYINGFINMCDFFGSILIFPILVAVRISVCCGQPLQKQEFILAGFAYFFNILRIFKYFPANKEIGIYSRVFLLIFIKDLYKFVILFAFIMMGYTGAIYLFTKSIRFGVEKSDKKNLFWVVFLKEIRSLTEAEAFQDDKEFNYDSLSTGFIILLTLNMFVIIVVLLNFLIGQISHRYGLALVEATLNNDIDKTLLIVRTEKLMKAKRSPLYIFIEGKAKNDEFVYVKNDKKFRAVLNDYKELKKEMDE